MSSGNCRLIPRLLSSCYIGTSCFISFLEFEKMLTRTTHDCGGVYCKPSTDFRQKPIGNLRKWSRRWWISGGGWWAIFLAPQLDLCCMSWKTERRVGCRSGSNPVFFFWGEPPNRASAKFCVIQEREKQHRSSAVLLQQWRCKCFLVQGAHCLYSTRWKENVTRGHARSFSSIIAVSF